MIVQSMPYPAAAAASGNYVGGATATFDGTGTTVSLTGLTGGLASAPAEGDVIVVAFGTVAGSNFPTTGITSSGYRQLANNDSADIYHTRLQFYAKRMAATPDTSFERVNLGTSYRNAIAVHVWRNIVGVSQVVVAGGANSPVADPPSITDASGRLLICAGLGGDTDATAFSSSDLENFVAASVDTGNVAAALGMGSINSTGLGFDPAAFTGFAGDGNGSWRALSSAFVVDTGSLTDTAATFETTATTGGSTSAYAAKGTILTARSDMVLTSVDIPLAPLSAETYKIVIAEVNDDGTIAAILGSSPGQTVSSTTTYTFTLSSAVAIRFCQRIAIIAVQTGAGATAVARVQFPGVVGASNTQWDYFGCVRYASVDPEVGDPIFFNSTNTVRMTLSYTYPA